MMMRIALATLIAIGLASCTATRKAQLSTSEPGFTEQLSKYETSFHPSDYDPDPGHGFTNGPDIIPNRERPTFDTVAISSSEIAQGFRVQLFSSMKIDEARAKKAEVEALFPTEWFYLEYESPSYKIRAGNFLTRFDAERFAKQLDEKGYPDSWTVPARVFKNPPPPPLK